MRWAPLYRRPPILRGVSASQIRADHAANQARINARYARHFQVRSSCPMSNQFNNARTSLQGVFMLIFINAFLIGTASGLRSLIGLAAVSWAAHFGILPLGHTWLAFLGYTFTPYILTLMAIGELVNDKLPKTPSRLIPTQFITRIATSGLCGLAIGLPDCD